MQAGSVIQYEADSLSAPIEIPDESPTAKAIRKAHLHTEADIKTIGALLWVISLLGALKLFDSLGTTGVNSAGLPGILFALAWIFGTALCGSWIRELLPRGRMLYTSVFFIGLIELAFEAPGLLALFDEVVARTTAPRAMLFAAFVLVPLLLRPLFLYVLWSRKGRMVMSQHYRDTIIPATPWVTHPRSRLAIAVGLAFLLMIAAIAWFIITGV